VGYYAAYLDVTGKRCLVVGGGREAEGKARGLVDAGALVVVTWSVFGDGLQQLAAEGRVALVYRESFEPNDLQGCLLVIDASGDEATGVHVAAAARARGALVNVLDRPQLCDFIAPALVRRGPLQVAISTEGRSPFMAAHLRRLLEGVIGEEHGAMVELVGELRDRLRSEGVRLEVQQQIYERIPGCGALELLREGKADEARAAIQACAAPELTGPA